MDLKKGMQFRYFIVEIGNMNTKNNIKFMIPKV